MEICSTTFDPATGCWTYPFTVLISPQGDSVLSHPRLEISMFGTIHLLYIATYEQDAQQVSELIYRKHQNGSWLEKHVLSEPHERVKAPELYQGSSIDGYPLVVVYVSHTNEVCGTFQMKSYRGQSIKALEKSGVDPSPWGRMMKHLLPINIR